MMAADAYENFESKAAFFDLPGILHALATGAKASDVTTPLKTLMSVLDSVSSVHPWIGVAVLPFKAILQLELNRRANDRRVLALISQMADMLQHLKELPRKGLPAGQGEMFDQILGNIRDRISDCGNAIDLYYKSKLIVRIIKSLKWQDKFEEFSNNFTQLGESLKTRITVVIHLTVLDSHVIAVSTETKVDDVQKGMDDIRALLRGRTAFEKDVMRYLEKLGGPDNVVRHDRELASLVKKVEGIETDNMADIVGDHAPRVRFSYDDQAPGNAYTYNYPQPEAPHGKKKGRRKDSTLDSVGATQNIPPVIPSDPPQGIYSVYRPGVAKAYSPYAAKPPMSAQMGQTQVYPQQPPMSFQPPGSNWQAPGMTPQTYPAHYMNKPSRTSQRGPRMHEVDMNNMTPQTGADAAYPISGQYPNMMTPQTQILNNSNTDVVNPDGTIRPGLLEQYRYEITFALETDLGMMLKRNEQVWEFTLMRFESEIKAHIDLGTERVLKKLSEGPWSKIDNEVLRKVWEEEKWSFSVDGARFIQGVQDYLEQDVAEDETWALKFLSVSYRNTLLHALDPDYSGFISVAEANHFTSTKPEKMSLLVWFAYRAVSWSYEANESHRQILEAREKLTDLLCTSRMLPPDVSQGVKDIESTVSNEFEDVLLSSLKISQRRIVEITGVPPLALLLENGLKSRREDMTTHLDVIRWEVSSQETLRAVMGSGPIENNILLVTALIVARLVESLETIPPLGGGRQERRFQTFIFPRIFETGEALRQITLSIDERVFYLIDSFPELSISQFAFGLFENWVPQDRPAQFEMPVISFSPPQRGSLGEGIAESPSIIGSDLPSPEEVPPTPRMRHATVDSAVDARPDDDDDDGEEPYKDEGRRPRARSRTRSFLHHGPGYAPIEPPVMPSFLPGFIGSTTSNSYPFNHLAITSSLFPSTRPTLLSGSMNITPIDEIVLDINVLRISREPAPPLPPSMFSCDILESEWSTFFMALMQVTQEDSSLRLTPTQRIRLAKLVVDDWNHVFFQPRFVHMRITKHRARKPKTTLKAIDDADVPSESDSISLDSAEDEDENLAIMLRLARRRRRKAVYVLMCGPLPLPTAQLQRGNQAPYGAPRGYAAWPGAPPASYFPPPQPFGAPSPYGPIPRAPSWRPSPFVPAPTFLPMPPPGRAPSFGGY
ncbi:hypothetical protein DL93DRAFT_339692 [Clavulina sp. PMI_390]|nr:hypothetical protein DL93DRAFT_339692 [Clavulina sp. PMI_390]